MVKNLLWILVTMAGLSLANPSKAALGWTWDECQQHWGKPLSSTTLPDGRVRAIFEAHDLSIVVWLAEVKVARVAYQGNNIEFSQTQLETLQNANLISPTAHWVFVGKNESTQDYTWELREADKTGEIAIAIYAVKVKAFIVFTAADDKRATAQSNQDASDL
jgi:hypothetical protein